MRRYEKIAEMLKIFPATIWEEPDSRSWDPDEEAECINMFRNTIARLREIYNATATLVEYEYPVRLSTTCIGASFSIKQKVERDPTVTFTVNEGLFEAINEFYVLAPGDTYSDGIVIIATLLATIEYLEKRLAEEIDFLNYITEEIDV
ncbi:MAG: hypothetical protein J7K40_05465 [candidate division Zixibacteria bacterium]|nr:hypothetical protein [candidate division Zixibacteria bacterium]